MFFDIECFFKKRKMKRMFTEIKKLQNKGDLTKEEQQYLSFLRHELEMYSDKNEKMKETPGF